LRDQEEADSATQDVFLKAYVALEKEGREIEEPGKWLTRIAANTCLDRLRSRRWQFWRKRPNPEDEATALAMAASTEPSAERMAFSTQITRRIGEAMNRLSDKQRAVFTLRHYEQRSLEEIAEAMDLELGTVKAHLSRALRKMRVELKDLYETGDGVVKE
jgi:RNA polymerase sigma-70 factor (ECF subfamily)